MTRPVPALRLSKRGMLTDEDAYVLGRGKRFMRVTAPIHKPATVPSARLSRAALFAVAILTGFAIAGAACIAF